MHPRTFLIVIAFGLLAAFVAVNWPAIVAPTTLSLIFTTVQAPLGIVLLGFLLLLSLFFVAAIGWSQGHALVEARRATRELEAERQRTAEADAARFRELRNRLDDAVTRLTQRQEDIFGLLAERLDRLQPAPRVEGGAGNLLSGPTSH